MKKITFLIACLLAVFGMSAINHYDNLYVDEGRRRSIYVDGRVVG